LRAAPTLELHGEGSCCAAHELHRLLHRSLQRAVRLRYSSRIDATPSFGIRISPYLAYLPSLGGRTPEEVAALKIVAQERIEAGQAELDLGLEVAEAA